MIASRTERELLSPTRLNPQPNVNHKMSSCSQEFQHRIAASRRRLGRRCLPGSGRNRLRSPAAHSTPT